MTKSHAKQQVIAWVLFYTLLLQLGGCGLLDDRASYHFEMKVEAITPQGVRSGSSVMAVYAVHAAKLTSEQRSGGAGLKGQAVELDLSDGPVFALLVPQNGRMIMPVAITVAFDPALRVPSSADWNEQFINTVHRLEKAGNREFRAELPRQDWPLLVRFRDLNDPKSMEKVDPASVGITRFVVATTKDPITSGIEKTIPWIDHLDRYLAIPGNPHTSTLPPEIEKLRIR